MGKQGAYAGLLSDQERTANNILEEASTDTTSLVADRNSEPGENNLGICLLPLALTISLRCLQCVYLSYVLAVVTDDRVIFG